MTYELVSVIVSVIHIILLSDNVTLSKNQCWLKTIEWRLIFIRVRKVLSLIKFIWKLFTYG